MNVARILVAVVVVDQAVKQLPTPEPLLHQRGPGWLAFTAVMAVACLLAARWHRGFVLIAAGGLANLLDAAPDGVVSNPLWLQWGGQAAGVNVADLVLLAGLGWVLVGAGRRTVTA